MSLSVVKFGAPPGVRYTKQKMVYRTPGDTVQYHIKMKTLSKNFLNSSNVYVTLNVPVLNNCTSV